MQATASENPNRLVLKPAVQATPSTPEVDDGPAWVKDGTVHRLHNFHTDAINVTDMYKFCHVLLQQDV